MKNKPMIAIIGAGNMGASLLGGLIKNHYPPESLCITDPDPKKLQALANQFSVHTAKNNLDAIQNADVIILAVKPQIIPDVTQEISAAIKQKKSLIISIAAGTLIDTLQKNLGNETAIVRCMPNTPALISCGATALYANKNVSPEQRDLAENILRAVSVIVWLENEKLMDVVTALSGSGPAYFFLLMEVLQESAEKLGLSKEDARLLTLQTAFGAARMALESDHTPAELRKHVTSPGGTTESALNVLEKNNIRRIFEEAVTAAKMRSEELGKQ
jgi:pyrroline-5-carboxylate reductase